MSSTAYQGVGRIKVGLHSSGVSLGLRKLRDTGNNSAFQFSFTTRDGSLRDYTDPAGGVDAKLQQIEEASGQIDFRHISAENFALLLWGEHDIKSNAAITGEVIAAHAGGFVPTRRIINRTVAPVLKKGATTLSTADYKVSDAGITFADTFATSGLTDGDEITIDYTPRAGYNVQALIKAAPLVSIVFEGINIVTGLPLVVRMYKARLGVAQQVGLIGDDFATFSVSFTLEKDNDDPSIAANDSRWFELDAAEAA